MKNKNAVAIAAVSAISALSLVSLGILAKKKLPKVNFKSYTENCLYMAYLDDKIARLRYRNIIGVEDKKFPSIRESLMFKYRYYLDKNISMSKDDMEEEIASLEEMLKMELKEKWELENGIKSNEDIEDISIEE